jgi:hypothetical protein
MYDYKRPVFFFIQVKAVYVTRAQPRAKEAR